MGRKNFSVQAVHINQRDLKDWRWGKVGGREVARERMGERERKPGTILDLPLTSSGDLEDRLLRFWRKFEASESCMKICPGAEETVQRRERCCPQSLE